LRNHDSSQFLKSVTFEVRSTLKILCGNAGRQVLWIAGRQVLWIAVRMVSSFIEPSPRDGDDVDRGRGCSNAISITSTNMIGQLSIILHVRIKLNVVHPDEVHLGILDFPYERYIVLFCDHVCHIYGSAPRRSQPGVGAQMSVSAASELHEQTQAKLTAAN